MPLNPIQLSVVSQLYFLQQILELRKTILYNFVILIFDLKHMMKFS